VHGAIIKPGDLGSATPDSWQLLRNLIVRAPGTGNPLPTADTLTSHHPAAWAPTDVADVESVVEAGYDHAKPGQFVTHGPGAKAVISEHGTWPPGYLSRESTSAYR